ncbi:MAG: glycerol-3-phosphate acyltransferase [Anaerolineae bacterium]|jgi:glycerol-3-phosphate acyltransferase PlsY
MHLAAIAVVSYLLGSLPVAHWVTRLATGQRVSIRDARNLSARDVALRVGRQAGVVTALLHALQGAAACLLARYYRGDQLSLLVAGLAVMLGRGFSVWLRFRGGSGLVTASGFFAALFPLSTLAAVPVFYLLHRLWPDHEFVLITGLVAMLLGSLAERASLPLTGIAVATLAMAGVKALVAALQRHAAQARSG